MYEYNVMYIYELLKKQTHTDRQGLLGPASRGEKTTAGLGASAGMSPRPGTSPKQSAGDDTREAAGRSTCIFMNIFFRSLQYTYITSLFSH